MKVKVQNIGHRRINLGVDIDPGKIVEVEQCDAVSYAEKSGKVKVLSAREIKEPVKEKIIKE